MSREDKYEDDYGLVGDANEVCSSGRSSGTPATRPTGIYKENLRFRIPQLLGTSSINCRVKNRKQYKSYWRKRKDTRRQNKLDFKNGKHTPSTEMMREFGINVNRPKFQKYEGKGTIADEWVQRGTGMCLMSKRGVYKYDYVQPARPVKKELE
jgi:hypothetical protein